MKAFELARQQGISRASFKASKGWVQKFMKRGGFSLRRRTSICQKLPQDFEEKLIKFQRFVLQKQLEKNYLPGQIGNADQTAVYFDMPHERTIDKIGQKQVPIRTCGAEKQRVTVMLCCTGDGRKLPPYIVLKRKTMPRESFPPGVIVRVNEKGWMTSQLVQEWLNIVWFRRPGAALNLPSMLVLDSYKGHLTKEVKSAMCEKKSDLVIIPGGMTSQLQPLDVCINKPFKDRLRNYYSEWLQSNEHKMTPAGRVKRASCSLLATWIKTAWQDIPCEMVQKAFKKCCITNAMDGSEDCLLWEESSNKEDSSDSDGSEESVP